MTGERLQIHLDALDIFETITEVRVVRVALKLAEPGQKLTAQTIAENARLPLTQAKRGIETALANGTLVAVGLEGKEKLRTFAIGPKLAPFVWAHNVPESDNTWAQSVTETTEGQSGLGTKRDQTLSDSGTKCDQSEDGTEVDLRAGDKGTYYSLPKEQESVKPEEKKIHGGSGTLTIRAVPKPEAAPRPTPTKRDAIQARAAERRGREAAERAERKRARDEAAEAKRAAKARAAADTIDLAMQIVAVQVVYRKIREVINCKRVAPSQGQQEAALAFARELVAGRLEPESQAPLSEILLGAGDTTADEVARVLCDDLDNWRVDYYSGALGEMRSKKPHVGDLRNTFETSVMTRSGELASIAERGNGHRAPPPRTNVTPIDAAKAANQRLREETAERKRQYLASLETKRNALDA